MSDRKHAKKIDLVARGAEDLDVDARRKARLALLRALAADSLLARDRPVV